MHEHDRAAHGLHDPVGGLHGPADLRVAVLVVHAREHGERVEHDHHRRIVPQLLDQSQEAGVVGQVHAVRGPVDEREVSAHGPVHGLPGRDAPAEAAPPLAQDVDDAAPAHGMAVPVLAGGDVGGPGEGRHRLTEAGRPGQDDDGPGGQQLGDQPVRGGGRLLLQLVGGDPPGDERGRGDGRGDGRGGHGAFLLLWGAVGAACYVM
ncbi:Uncharacterised protein [Streptococcus pneumoniae]|nr:Uncharacterised protein [Streptococcus pneumoniae]